MIDIDIWVDLPERQSVRLMNLVLKQGGAALAQRLYALAEGRLINFLFRVDGLRDFAVEFKGGLDAKIEGEPDKRLPLEGNLKSKQALLWDRDRVHLFHFKRFLKGRKKMEGFK